MKSFYKKLVAFGLFFIASSILIVVFDYAVIGNQYTQNYQASLIDKVNRLYSIDEPKIMLVGNSNVCFGMDSELIQKEFHMPVVDLGLHGGLGNAFHENIAKLNIQKGDIVIICHSDYGDDDSISDPDLALMTLEWNTDLWNILREKDYLTVLKAYPSYLFNAIRLWITNQGNKPLDSCYTRGAFNEYGDVVYDRPTNEYTITEEDVKVPEISDQCVNRLNALHQYISERGATMLIAGYPIADGEYTPAKTEYEVFQKQLEEKLDATIISNFTDYFLPYSYFYNTHLHLTNEGASMRTEQLIRELHSYLG